jgi:hypothetical protein
MRSSPFDEGENDMRSNTALKTARPLAALVMAGALCGTAFAQSAPAEQPTSPSQPTAPANPSMPTSPTPTPAAQADDGKALVRVAFSRADANKDGKLTPDEATVLPAVAAKFAQLDTNHDGSISEDEFTTGVRIGN